MASGLASPAAVKRAAFASFGVAAVAGLAIALDTSLVLLVVGAAAIAAGWFYTGGPKPYGYRGLGEVFVFVFFGLVATARVDLRRRRKDHCAVGRRSGASQVRSHARLLVINNLRDIPTDRDVGKRTLAVRLGDSRTRSVALRVVDRWRSFRPDRGELRGMAALPRCLGLLAAPLALPARFARCSVAPPAVAR